MLGMGLRVVVGKPMEAMDRMLDEQRKNSTSLVLGFRFEKKDQRKQFGIECIVREQWYDETMERTTQSAEYNDRSERVISDGMQRGMARRIQVRRFRVSNIETRPSE
jgi:hypothetical protein